MEHHPPLPTPLRRQPAPDGGSPLPRDVGVSDSPSHLRPATLRLLINDVAQSRQEALRTPRSAIIEDRGWPGFPFPQQQQHGANIASLLGDIAQRDEDYFHSSTPVHPPLTSRPDFRKPSTIHELRHLQKNSPLNSPVEANSELDNRYKPHTDALQETGMDAFVGFERRAIALDRRLLSFHNSVQHLGSGAGLVASAVQLRIRLVGVLLLLREQVSVVYPGIKKEVIGPTVRAVPEAWLSTSSLPMGLEEDSSPERIPLEFERLAIELYEFLECINHISEFAEEAINTSVTSFACDIRYWASCLREFKGRMTSPSVALYAHELATGPFSEHMSAVTDALANFVDFGVPTIRLAQQQTGSAFLNLSTVSTLFSAVTATVVQYSYQSQSSGLEQAVNLLWITSLVFSLASAINSQLAYAWHTYVYRSPRSLVPWWGLFVIKQAPLFFLVISVLAFSAGLVCFCFSVFPRTVIPLIITVCTSFSSTTLFLVIFWFAGERWVFTQTCGKLWLADLVNDCLSKERYVVASRHLCTSILQRWRKLRQWLSVVLENSRGRIQPIHRAPPNLDVERPEDPHPTTVIPPGSPALAALGRSRSRRQSIPLSVRVSHLKPPKITLTSSPSEPSSVSRVYPATYRPIPLPVIIPALRRLNASPALSEHAFAIRHLAFSPNGGYLASCSWDSTVIIWRVGDPFQVYRRLDHITATVAQIAWSPSGRLLLTRSSGGLRIWDHMVNARDVAIDRSEGIQSASWLPRGNTVMSVEGSSLHIFNVQGSAVATHTIDRFLLHDAAVVRDENRVVAVATLEKSIEGIYPSKSEPERRVIVYNLLSGVIEDQIPIRRPARWISLSEKNDCAMITFSDRGPPQLIKLNTDDDGWRVHLSPMHIYLPAGPTTFTGPSTLGSFIGTSAEDQMVVAVGRAGETLIWDRESARLLHTAHSKELGIEHTVVSWNHGSNGDLMFATGATDGSIRIWTAPCPTSDDYGGT
ncbi:uncharacterized protein EI90DRAFT_2974806 [Cantharellus anzutake]|uniref:uncharacterized protein n=1 Tax=Cantharellus anzutake TaxID=1750568 RepID=UPI001904C2FA|nr:uncharacterized protein EI90DRAFT_2974806 [Cantharellus anzutake]KAF8327905.1 hypothetical protein EI90DRAFT_2974806 [Cantharellus anzutake]